MSLWHLSATAVGGAWVLAAAGLGLAATRAGPRCTAACSAPGCRYANLEGADPSAADLSGVTMDHIVCPNAAR